MRCRAYLAFSVLLACGSDPTVPVETSETGSGEEEAGEAGEMGDGDETGESGDTGIDPDRQNVWFILSETVDPPSLGGLEGADAVCQAAAEDAGLEGRFLAWLSTTEVDAKDRFVGVPGWVRPDGLPVATSLDSLTADGPLYPPFLNENGEVVSGSWIATGTASDGTSYPGEGDFPLHCGNYTDEDGGIVVGRAGVDLHWTSERDVAVNCDVGMRLYCASVDGGLPVTFDAPTDARVAFISKEPWTPPGGLEGADEHCQTEAEAAGLTGEFLAVLHVEGAAAMDRFDLDGPPWLRPDGVQLGETASDVVLPAGLLAAIDQHADGTDLDPQWYHWGVGNLGALPEPGQTCEDWTNPLQGGMATPSGRSGPDWASGAGSAQCDDGLVHLLCFQR